MKISFGAKLLTTPEEFCWKKDTPQQREHIREFLSTVDMFLKCKNVNKISPNDTVKIERFPRKGGYGCTVHYHAPAKNQTYSSTTYLAGKIDKINPRDFIGVLVYLQGDALNIPSPLTEPIAKYMCRLYGFNQQEHGKFLDCYKHY